MAENELLQQMEKFQEEAIAALEKVKDESSLAQWRVMHLGNQYPFHKSLPDWRNLKRRSSEIGQAANLVRITDGD